jgi:hypothetical protein
MVGHYIGLGLLQNPDRGIESPAKIWDQHFNLRALGTFAAQRRARTAAR